MRASRSSMLAVVLFSAGLTTFLATSEALAQRGRWEWGPGGFSAAWTAEQRLQYIWDYGIADPNANYWTPFWSGANGSNVYTGVPDTGARNTFAVNHDINAHYGIPLLGYLDIITPLLGTNEAEIATTVSETWNSIVDGAPSVQNDVTDVWYDDFDDYGDYGTYWDFDFDNGFDYDFGDYGGWGGGGGGGCFAPGTPITLADGSSRSIEDVRVGDHVLAYDVKRGATVASPVTQTIVHDGWKDRAGTVLINGTLRATANHPFFVNGRWTRADRIRVGDVLLRAAGGGALALTQRGGKARGAAAPAGVSRVKVSSVKRLPGLDTVYNLEVADQHNYFSGGVLVHNLYLVDCN